VPLPSDVTPIEGLTGKDEPTVTPMQLRLDEKEMPSVMEKHVSSAAGFMCDGAGRDS